MADWILYLVLGVVSIVSALGLLTSRNAVHAALYLVLNFITAAVFYLLMNAPFLAGIQVSVYAGAIMVLFVFVIMLLGPDRLQPSDAGAAPSTAAPSVRSHSPKIHFGGDIRKTVTGNGVPTKLKRDTITCRWILQSSFVVGREG